jgi:hypothetical protein
MFHFLSKIIIVPIIFIGSLLGFNKSTPPSLPSQTIIIENASTESPKVVLKNTSQPSISTTPTPATSPKLSNTKIPTIKSTPTPTPKEECPWWDLRCKVSTEPTPTPQIIYIPAPTPIIIYQTPIPTTVQPTPTPVPTPTPTPTPILAKVTLGPATPPNFTIDPQEWNNYTIWWSNATIETKPALLTSIQLRQIGSINRTDIQNLRFFVDDVQFGNTLSQADSNGYVIFSGSVTLAEGIHSLKLVADITGGCGRNFYLSLRARGDLVINDTQAGSTVWVWSYGNNNFPLSAGTQTIAPPSDDPYCSHTF